MIFLANIGTIDLWAELVMYALASLVGVCGALVVTTRLDRGEGDG